MIASTKIGRHLVWSNFYIPKIGANEIGDLFGKNNLDDKANLMDWLGIHFDENIYYEKNHCPTQVLRNCVHPDLGLHIFNAGIGKTNEQEDLFN
jgi:DNA (cytosine-5)-methyltransferase 1